MRLTLDLSEDALMRKLLIATLLTTVAAPAFAKDSGDAAFELLATYETETQQDNYIKLKSTLPFLEVTKIDAKFSKLYGEPAVSRSGLKVWQIENTRGRGAKHVTIMCGSDKQGGYFISVDRRGKAQIKPPKGLENKKAERARTSTSTYPKSTSRSQERD